MPAIRADLDLTRGEMGLVLGAWQLVYLGASVPAGKLIDRIGLRWSLVIAAAVIASSGIARAAADDLTFLLVTVALFGIGGPLVSIGAPKLVSVWFAEAERRTAVGIYGTAPAIGMTVALALANGVVAPAFDDSWRWTMVAFASVGLVAAGYWLVVSAGASEPGGAVARQSPLSSRALLELPIVRLILALAVGGFLYSHAVGNWLVEILEDGGRTASAAGYWAAIPTFVGIFATLAVPRLATPRRRVPLLAGVFALGGLGLALVSVTAVVVLAPALVATGIARTTMMPLAMLILMDDERVGSANMAAAGGLFFTAAEVGGVLGPLLTGALAQSTGGFGLPIALLVATMGAMAALTFAIPAAARR